MTEKAILVVSFGTSVEETRGKTIEAIEQDLAAAYPDRVFYRAWTSKMILKKIQRTQGLHIDDLDEAFHRLRADGIRDLLVVPTVLTAGGEYQKIQDKAAEYHLDFDSMIVSFPLLSGADDIRVLARTLEQLFGNPDPEEMTVFMGHGSEYDHLHVYERLNEIFAADGFTNYCVGTVEFDPGLDPVLRMIRERRPNRVILSPLMIVAGDHALNDMAGEEPDSWKSLIEGEGVPAECILKGLGEYSAIRELYIRHAREACPN